MNVRLCPAQAVADLSEGFAEIILTISPRRVGWMTSSYYYSITVKQQVNCSSARGAAGFQKSAVDWRDLRKCVAIGLVRDLKTQWDADKTDENGEGCS